MKQILVHSPGNLHGLITTATTGDLGELIGQEVKMIDAADQDLCFGDVKNAWVGPLAHAPAMLLEQSNDPLQRSFTGLRTHLSIFRAEGESTPDADTEITILVIECKASTLIRPTGHQIARHGG
jgi:hypothetical protein